MQASCSSNSWPNCLSCGNCWGCRDTGEVCEKPTVRALARDLDTLEDHVEKFGSVVAGHADVWGQARLSKHREEYETQMAAELGNFQQTLQGSVFGTDQAYFADAFALSAAAGGNASPTAAAAGTGAAATAPFNGFFRLRDGGKSVRVAVSTPIAISPPASPTSAAPAAAAAPTSSPTPLNQALPFPDQSDTFSGFTSMSRTPVIQGAALSFAGAQAGIQLEPAVYLDQKSRFINHLQELRRINEGDDTADSPGYALNLVRIPVSVLPGRCTGIGHGAEVTMTMTPYLSPELLPTTFRNLILNDLVDQIGLPVTVFINDPNNSVYFAEKV